ncbi:MAG: hypothetical protein HXY50_06735 [Ignavibacteriaceae bacterium]|nr:hypothetical protein [Ignavibacteriaceae bacterium]
MVGKATIFVVAGFSLLFLVVEYNMGNISTRAVENFTEYYLQNHSREIAVSGINFAANKIFLDPTWTAGFTNYEFKENQKEGIMNVKVEVVDAVKNYRKITSTGEYQGVTSTVEVMLIPSKFSKFAYYSESEGINIWWMSKDTVWGPFHTQDKMRIDGKPTFYGKVTNKLGIEKKDKYSKANFYGGYQTGVDLAMPTNELPAIEALAASGGKTITGKDTVYLTFVSDSIKVRYTYSGSTSTYLTSAFAPNGIIVAKDAIVRLKGTVKGQYTVVSSSTLSSKGDIYLDDDILCSSSPRTNQNTTDILGIVAKNDVIITENSANNNNINIDASIYCEAGSFFAENHKDRPVSGSINLCGGITQKTRGAVGTFSGSTIKSGFSKNYRYDDRLLLMSPPAFPGTGGFEIVSWYE